MAKKNETSDPSHPLDNVILDNVVSGKEAVDPTLAPDAPAKVAAIHIITGVAPSHRMAFVKWAAEQKPMTLKRTPDEWKALYEEFKTAKPQK